MKAFFKGIFPSVILFLYIYPQMILGFPISTRVMMGVFGFFTILKRFRPGIFKPFQGAWVIALFSVSAALYNETWDFYFVGYVGSMLIISLAAYFFISVFPKFSNSPNNINGLLKTFIIVVLIQSAATLIMFVYSPIGELVQNIFPIQARETTLENSFGFRLLGVGTAFFGAGVVHGLALITIVYLYLRGCIKRAFIWIIYYLFIFFVGLMMARTTVVGLCFSILLLITWKPFNLKTNKKKFKWIIFLSLFSVFTLIYVLAKANENLLNFAFEFFYNYDNTGSFESASTNHMMTMYRWPTKYDTWIFGDGIFNTSEGYYMRTDIGFLRLIYYGGLPIMIAYFYFSWYIIRQIKKLGPGRLFSYFLSICFVYQIALNIKGLVDLNFFFLLIFTCFYLNKIKCRALLIKHSQNSKPQYLLNV